VYIALQFQGAVVSGYKWSLPLQSVSALSGPEKTALYTTESLGIIDSAIDWWVPAV